ncbi:hypothetical protein [Sphingomonas melonis]|uniref:hypothetical protein n=1 Tax=Sphingomonas melonis TaxID=152682 RepID=UPI001E30B163|nr:hypothetical protein [Sphingomonas melonis]
MARLLRQQLLDRRHFFDPPKGGGQMRDVDGLLAGGDRRPPRAIEDAGDLARG